ncbi:MAG TPA: helix-turn-helix domain-containing protein [Actinomycetes bacterium]|nr:helix-turn-helix domain-containing protein [Actinomycetes bacterium]
MPTARASAATVRRLERASGDLASEAMTRMEATLPWFRGMAAEDRSWITLVAQAGIGAFVEWYGRPEAARTITADVFGSAPRELTRAVSLQQTVELVRVTIEVVEERSAELAAPGDESQLRESVLVYAREVAFAAAEVYAGAAEARGAWDARLEALLADSLLRGEFDDEVRSRAAALGWRASPHVFAVAGQTPDATAATVVDALRRASRHAGLDVVTGVHGHELVAVFGGDLGQSVDPLPAAAQLATAFGSGPVVVGPVVPDLSAAPGSASAALSGFRAAAAWPDAPRPVSSDQLLPERALDGDEEARRRLVEQVYRPLVEAGGGLLDTAAAVLEQSPSLEGAARQLFVHTNTVRYRMRRIAEVCGRTPTEPRDAFTLKVALTLGRLDDRPRPRL